MQLSTRGRYAVMALLDLAVLQENRKSGTPVTLAQIAERQAISLSYLEQLFARLRKGGVVESVRGPGGGYVLARPVGEIFLNDVISAVNEPTTVTRCGHEHNKTAGSSGCVHGKRCNAHQLWHALGEHIETFMANVTLGMVLTDSIDPSQLTPQALFCENTTVRIQPVTAVNGA